MDYLWSGGIDQVRVSTADGEWRDRPVLAAASFNARGQRTASTLGNGIQLTYTYDPETYRLNRLTATRPAQNPTDVNRTYQDIEYVYDPVGNLTYLLDRAQEPETASPHVFEGLNTSSACEYAYDAFYQLTQASGRVHRALQPHDYLPNLPEVNAIKASRYQPLNNLAAVERYTRHFTYDLAGNLQNTHHQGDSRTWNREMQISLGSNRSLLASDHNGLPVRDLEGHFDANGNCTALPHVRQMDWNARNQLTRAIVIDRSAEGNPSDGELYIYGGDGMRVRKVSQAMVRSEGPGQPQQLEITEKIYLEGCEIKRVYRNGDLVLERMTSHITDESDTIARLYKWTRDDRRSETDDVSENKIHYQLSNHLGSAALEVSERGELISYEEYFPFGGTAFIAGRNVREVKLKYYRYCGKERDDVTSFYYYGYRYYVPWMGRWLSPDPIGPEDSVNLYVFVGNNPINVTDLNGLSDDEDENETWWERALRSGRRILGISPEPLIIANLPEPVEEAESVEEVEEVYMQRPGTPFYVSEEHSYLSMNISPIDVDPVLEEMRFRFRLETEENPEARELAETTVSVRLGQESGQLIDIQNEEAEEQIAQLYEELFALSSAELEEYRQCQEDWIESQFGPEAHDIEHSLGVGPYPEPATSVPNARRQIDIAMEMCPGAAVEGAAVGGGLTVTAIVLGKFATVPVIIFGVGAILRGDLATSLETERDSYVRRCIDPNLEARESISEVCNFYGGVAGGVGAATVTPQPKITMSRRARAAREAEEARVATEAENARAVREAEEIRIAEEATALERRAALERDIERTLNQLEEHPLQDLATTMKEWWPTIEQMQQSGEVLNAAILPENIHPRVLEAIANEQAGLTILANQLKNLGRHVKPLVTEGTVEIVLARLPGPGGQEILVAGKNTSHPWTQAQINELNMLGIEIAPQQTGFRYCAEYNIAWHLTQLNATPIRWSRAVVGRQGRHTRSNSFLCESCWGLVQNQAGGIIEPGLHGP